MKKISTDRVVTPATDCSTSGENLPPAKALTRAERLAAIRSALDAGSYRINSDQLAARIMERISNAEPQEQPDQDEIVRD